MFVYRMFVHFLAMNVTAASSYGRPALAARSETDTRRLGGVWQDVDTSQMVSKSLRAPVKCRRARCPSPLALRHPIRDPTMEHLQCIQPTNAGQRTICIKKAQDDS